MSTLKRKKCFYFSLVNPDELASVKIEVKRLHEHTNIWPGSDQRSVYAQGGTYRHGKQWLIPILYSALRTTHSFRNIWSQRSQPMDIFKSLSWAYASYVISAFTISHRNELLSQIMDCRTNYCFSVDLNLLCGTPASSVISNSQEVIWVLGWGRIQIAELNESLCYFSFFILIFISIN